MPRARSPWTSRRISRDVVHVFGLAPNGDGHELALVADGADPAANAEHACRGDAVIALHVAGDHAGAAALAQGFRA